MMLKDGIYSDCATATSITNALKLFYVPLLLCLFDYIAGCFFPISPVSYLKKNLPAQEAIYEGHKAENNGLYEEAVISYEDALREIKKSRFRRNLESEIRQKLKVLHTVTTYTKDQDFVRENNSWIR